MDEKRLMAAQAASLSRIGTRILNGLRLAVNWLLPPCEELGYTAEGKPVTVNVAWDNDQFMGEMNEDEKTFFRMGVFAHETLHQVFTNFAYSNRICDKLSQAEAAIFMKFANTLEDPAIEYFAPNVMGGKLLAALKYSIAVIYKKSPGIDESGSAFAQMLNALIHFGDCGIIKGKFTFPEAEEYFNIIAPMYNEGITCPDSRRRLDIARECMEKTRPLWEEYVKDQEAWEQLLKELIEFLKKHGTPSVDEDELKGDEESPKSGARGITLKGMDKSNGKGDPSDDNESEDSSSEDSGDSASEGKGKSKGESEKDDKDSEDSKGDGGSKGPSETDDDTDSASGSDSNNQDTDTASKGKPPEHTTGKIVPDQTNSADEILEDDLMIDQEMLESIKRDIAEEEKKIVKAEREEANKTREGDLPSFDIDSQYFKSASCLNRRITNVSSTMKSDYNALVTSFNWEVKTLTKALEKLFSADKEETVRATSGSYNIKRGAIGCTARIMDKSRDPANKKDACVCLCVDLSGSMCSADKIGQARKASIVFAEALRKLNIPYYIMGFRADGGADAVHDHFVTWDGKGRETLSTMRAGGNNFDGYSIRYAGNLLKCRPESNKLLFIISDGEPACGKYRTWESGIADTYQAVKETKKICKVFGIALGAYCEPDILQSFYGKDFIHCNDEKLLTNTLAKKLVKQFK